MRFTPPKFEKLEQMAAIDVARLTEDEARKLLENIRWPYGITCPRCGSQNVNRIRGKSENTRDGLLQCRDCRKHFTVTVGTIMERSHITLRQWLQAFHLMSESKKGISALQLQRHLCLGSYESAWFLCHRIRHAMTQRTLVPKLKGTIEVDETYVGGKAHDGTTGRGSSKKTPVLVLVERDGSAYSQPVERVDGKTLKGAIREMVAKESRIMTDEFPSYKGIGKEFKGGHETVNHGQGEYARGDANTNTAESYFALLKRGVHGTFHHISKQHLSRYCEEFSFRWNHRGESDGERTVAAVKGVVGKRLLYSAH